MAAEVPTDVPIQPPVTLPPYPEMILTAIEELGNAEGSNKSSISKQIESTYGELPPAHSTLLTHHLNNMKKSGQLVLSKNNYLVPDPNSPPPRGRGRPPKPKSDDAAAAAPAGSPRPRGRPPKTVDPDAPAAPAGPSRPRGRPPKDPNAPPAPKAASSGKGRGRPPKAKTGGGAASAAPVVGVKRGRGRPPKSVEPNVLPRDIRVLVLPVLAPATLPSYPEMILTAIEGLNNSIPSSAPRGRGRKPKSSNADVPQAGSAHPRGRPPKSSNADAPQAGSARPRGRPSKTKALPAPHVGTPRSRGRPAKAVDPNAVLTIKPASSGRGRGRPPKKAKTDGDVASASPVVGVKRSRGRPPKVKA